MSRYVRSTLPPKQLYRIVNFYEPEAEELILDYLDDVWGEHYKLDSEGAPHEKSIALRWCFKDRALKYVDSNHKPLFASCQALQPLAGLRD